MVQRTVIFSIGLLLVFVACGRTSNQPAAQTASQIDQKAAVNTASTILPSPTLAKKFVFDTQVAISIATEIALSPTPYEPNSTFPPSPTIRPDELSNSCQLWRNFIPSNCWVSENRGLGVQAGYQTLDPQQGRIQVFNNGLATYDTPYRIGVMKIYVVNYPIVDLYTNTTHLLFNLETRQWLDLAGTPIPSPTEILIPISTPER